MNPLNQRNFSDRQYPVQGGIRRRALFGSAVATLLSGCFKGKNQNFNQIRLDQSFLLGPIADKRLSYFLATLLSSPSLPWEREPQKMTLNFEKEGEGEYSVTLEMGKEESKILTIVRNSSGADFGYVYDDTTHNLRSRYSSNLSLFSDHLLEIESAMRQKFPGF